MIWGLHDTQDNCWLGNDDGPLTYAEHIDARIAAQTIDMMLGNEPGRTRAKEYDVPATKLRDELTPKMTAEKALWFMENTGKLQ